MVEPNEREITVKSIIAHYILRHWPHFAFDFELTAVMCNIEKCQKPFRSSRLFRLEPSSSPILFSSQFSAFIVFFLPPRSGSRSHSFFALTLLEKFLIFHFCSLLLPRHLRLRFVMAF
jgi:hypothetical protein